MEELLNKFHIQIAEIESLLDSVDRVDSAIVDLDTYQNLTDVSLQLRNAAHKMEIVINNNSGW